MLHFPLFSSFFALHVVLIHLRTIMGGRTTEGFKNLLKEALEPLHKSIDEMKKSIATANFKYY